jgi:ribosome-associated toxin RatA of RatAB toxin-antitoxin module
MRTFELIIFLDCERDRVYDHLSEPINMIGLQPLLTEINVLKERRGENNVSLRPFHMVETFRWMGLPVFRNRIYSVIHLTKPRDELEIHVYSRLKTRIIFKYEFRQFNDGRTQVTLTVRFVRVNKLLESLLIHRAKHAQRALLSNLKVRLEKH